jgi:hypothetical protein
MPREYYPAGTNVNDLPSRIRRRLVNATEVGSPMVKDPKTGVIYKGNYLWHGPNPPKNLPWGQYVPEDDVENDKEDEEKERQDKERLRQCMRRDAMTWIDYHGYEIEYETEDKLGLIKRHERPRLDRHQTYEITEGLFGFYVRTRNDQPPTTCERCEGHALFMSGGVDVVIFDQNNKMDVLHVCSGCRKDGEGSCHMEWNWGTPLGVSGFSGLSGFSGFSGLSGFSGTEATS